MEKILITGGAGYIGSVLARQLINKGYAVRVVDCLRYGGESIIGLLDHPDFEFMKADICDRTMMETALTGVEAVVHLAAIVGDPACSKAPELAKAINVEGSMRLYDLAEQLGVGKFVFASTCSNYGKMKDPESYVNEESLLNPVSLYAETKVAFEQFLLNQPQTKVCSPTCLRFATAYGLSPRIRFDLTVNEFTKELALGRELLIFGEQFWRPYCHVEDLARAIIVVLEADEQKVAYEVFNVGDTDENYQKKMIFNCIKEQIPGARVKYVTKKEDPRDYRVSFEKIDSHLGFSCQKKVPDGIREIKDIVAGGFLLNPDDPKFLNTGAGGFS